MDSVPLVQAEWVAITIATVFLRRVYRTNAPQCWKQQHPVRSLPLPCRRHHQQVVRAQHRLQGHPTAQVVAILPTVSPEHACYSRVLTNLNWEAFAALPRIAL